MNPNNFRLRRFFYVLLASSSLAACGGGSGGGGGTDTDNDNDDDDDDENPAIVYNCDGTGNVVIDGKAKYEFVPAVEGGASGPYLDYDAAKLRPIRQAEIQAICPDGSSVYDTGVTDDSGAYSLSVPENVDVAIRVRALTAATGGPAWDLQIVDNTNGQAVWAVQGDDFDSGTGSATVNLRAGSGWDGSSYANDRAAGPFAIMDTIYTAMLKVMSAEPAASFPALMVNWSPENLACSSDQPFPFADGCVGTSFFSNFGGSDGRNIFILGGEDGDTDEYDDHIIVHEWGHYYEDAFARSDSIGGQHTGGSRLDMRVAFGEGWGNAWSGIATDDPVYVDTSGSGQAGGFSFNVDDETETNPGWWNESSVQEILYDLYDSGVGDDDIAALDFAPLHAVLTDEQRNTAAATSIFPLIHFLKQDFAADVATLAAIDAVVKSHDISIITDEWGAGRGNDEADEAPPDADAGAGYVSPIYTDISAAVAGGTTTVVCGTNEYADAGNEYNRIGARRFMTFQVPASDNWLVTLDGSANNGNLGGTAPGNTDPDFFIALNGEPVTADFVQEEPASGVDNSAADPNPDGVGPGIETATVALVAGELYTIEAVEYLNVDDDNATGGDGVCLDLTFVQQ
ncbi:MAG TPA: hypothetical protein VF194_09370 [Ferrovibrio sp.]|uniref:hypothetical protein n=1 Tax=Ferrovibrio sp. TaxID=1917215 RepID=UPI002ED6ABB3